LKPEGPESVFGDFRYRNIARQVSIASIGQEAGLSFGRLAEFDPLRDTAPLEIMSAMENATGILTDPQQIR